MTKLKEKVITIKDAMKGDNIDFLEFYNVLNDIGIGDWDSINSRDIIEQYITEMMRDGVHVSHMLAALESSYADIFAVWLGNSMETPEPIETKEELVEALGLDDEDLESTFKIQEDDSNIALKGGLIKSWDFSDDFYNDNQSLCDELDELYDRMFDGVSCQFAATEKNKENQDIKVELCDILDKFYNLGVKIWNRWDDETYQSKEEYREYILNYGKEEDDDD